MNNPSAMDANAAAARFTIGDLARTTGLPVKTIRWYSDQGLVPPAGRSAAGYRLRRLGFRVSGQAARSTGPDLGSRAAWPEGA